MSYGTANGTALAGTDYTAKTGTLTFTQAAAGSQTFTVQTTDDTLDEGSGRDVHGEYLQPRGRRRPGAEPERYGSKSVTTTITDDDATPTGITLSANPNSLGEDDACDER